MQAAASIDARIGRFSPEILSFIRRRAPAYAEEIAQETWMRVAAAAPDCPDDRAFRAYAYTVARRLLVDHYRRGRSRIQLVPLEGGLEPPSQASQHGSVIAGEVLAVVEHTLEGMKPEIAEVFRLRMTSSMSFKEIAQRQGVGLNTALGRMHNATKKMAAALRAAGLEPGGAR